MSEAHQSNPGLDGCLLLDKPQGMTSQQGVTAVKRALGLRKAGHAGTLDPMATGLLIIGLGRATRLLGHIADKGKSYEAVIRLGTATTTDDAEGELIGEPRDATCLSSAQIDAAMARQIGDIDQVPSAVSAIKVNGRRAYALVREGQTVELKARHVTVSRFDVTGRTDDTPWVDLTVSVDCSTGTYVRALARDLGRDLGVGGHLTALRRTRIGQFDVAQAVGVDGVRPEHVVGIDQAARWVAPVLAVTDQEAWDVAHGRVLHRHLDRDLMSIFHNDRFIALYRPDSADSGLAQASAVFVTPAMVGEPTSGQELDETRVGADRVGGQKGVS